MMIKTTTLHSLYVISDAYHADDDDDDDDNDDDNGDDGDDDNGDDSREL